MAETVKRAKWPVRKISPAWLLTIFGILIPAMILGFDGCFGWSAYRQVRALDYATTAGVITASVVTKQENTYNDRSYTTHSYTTYSAEVKYNYRVAGKAYSGNRYRYGQGSASDHNAARIVGEHPVGKKVVVHYCRENPADSLLYPGLEGSDLFMGMFLLPFNVVLFGILALVGRVMCGRCFGRRGAGTKVWDDGLVVRVRLPFYRPMLFAALAAVLLAFFGMFPIFIFDGAFYPSKSLMYRVWPAILGGTLLAYVVAAWRESRGGHDLVVDTAAGTVSLPPGSGRKHRTVMPLGELTLIEVCHAGPPGSQEALFPGHCPTLIFTDAPGITRAETLVHWIDSRRAEALAAWLRQRLNVAG